MNVTVKKDDSLEKDTLVINHNCTQKDINELKKFLLHQDQSEQTLIVYSKDEQIYINVQDLIFFETEGQYVYAHTHEDVYLCKYRLYELEDLLTGCFVRISKSTICNTDEVYSLSRTLRNSTSVSFRNSPKTVYVSRMYLKDLKTALEKRINL